MGEEDWKGVVACGMTLLPARRCSLAACNTDLVGAFCKVKEKKKQQEPRD